MQRYNAQRAGESIDEYIARLVSYETEDAEEKRLNGTPKRKAAVKKANKEAAVYFKRKNVHKRIFEKIMRERILAENAKKTNLKRKEYEAKQKDIDERTPAFMEEYHALCKKHGLELVSYEDLWVDELDWLTFLIEHVM